MKNNIFVALIGVALISCGTTTPVNIQKSTDYGALPKVKDLSKPEEISGCENTFNQTPKKLGQAEYPIAADRLKASGSVILQYEITQNGIPSTIELVYSEPENLYTESALKKLRSTRFALNANETEYQRCSKQKYRIVFVYSYGKDCADDKFQGLFGACQVQYAH